MSITAVPSSMRLVRAAAAASSGNGDASCWAKWCTRKYAPSAPASSAATASSIDCSRASAPERTCECGEADQCPKDRNPIFFTAQSTRRRRPSFRRSEEHTSELQSHVNLVCRLLLEKKKKQK